VATRPYRLTAGTLMVVQPDTGSSLRDCALARQSTSPGVRAFAEQATDALR